MEYVSHARLTITGDFIGRTLRRTTRLGVVNKTFDYNTLVDPTSTVPGCAGFPGNVCRSVSLDELVPRSGNVTLLLGAAGARFNLAGNLLVSGSALFPLTKAGFRSGVTTVLGLAYSY